MKTLEEPPYLTVGTDVSAKYRGAFCEAKIKTAKRLVKAKVTFKPDLSTAEVHDENIKGPLKVGAVVEVKNQDGVYQEATINKLTDASIYTVVSDKVALRLFAVVCLLHRRSTDSPSPTPSTSAHLSWARRATVADDRTRFKKKLSSSSSEEEESDQRQNEDLFGKVVCVEGVVTGDKKDHVVSSSDVTVKKDNIFVRSFKDGKFYMVLRKDVREMNSDCPPKADAGLKPGEFREEVEPFPEERENFLQQLYKFMEDRGTPINKRPVLGYRNLNLFKLYRLVHKLGGFDNIESGSIWKQVYQDLGIPVLNSAAGYNVKCAYRKYLYGFEEYCTSCAITFRMDLPLKQAPKGEVKPEGEAEGAAPTSSSSEEQKPQVDGEPSSAPSIVCKEEKPDATPNKMEAEPSKPEGKDGTNDEDDEEGAGQKGDADEGSSTAHLGAENMKQECDEEQESKDNSGKDILTIPCCSQNPSVVFVITHGCVLPPGMKVQVRYGRGRNLKTYEATVKEADVEGGEVLYLVHYCGWNVRYDEWIKADKIVRPANKNVPKIKHRKKIKNKAERERDRLERLNDREVLGPSSNNNRVPRTKCGLSQDVFSKMDEGEDKGTQQSPVKSIEITSILNGLQASEMSTDESEHEDEEGEHNEEDRPGCRSNLRKAPPEPAQTSERWESGTPPEGSKPSPVSGKSQDLASAESADVTKRRSQPESEGEVSTRKRKSDSAAERPPKGQAKAKTRNTRSADWLPGGSPRKLEERAAGPEEERGASSNSSSEDEGATQAESQAEESQRSRPKTKVPPLRKKRAKTTGNAEERPAVRSKGQKDVWSSIQAQWPKKTLKELFSDSDTEAANSPPPPVPSCLEEPGAEQDAGPEDEASEEQLENEKLQEFPSSGSNSVLNTPPTTPESPPEEAALWKTRVKCSLPPRRRPHPPPCLQSQFQTLFPRPHTGGGGRRTQRDGQQHGGTSVSQKRQKESQTGGASKKHKPNRKSLGVPPKKNRKTANSSDSEDQSVVEGAAKSTASKSNASDVKAATSPKCHGRSPPSSHKYHKQGDADHGQHRDTHGRSPRVYKWSFQMSDLEKMSSLERISFLQEKLQDIRNHYLSLKSEVASIDRRRKRMKKKERESTVAASSSSSSSSSPSSSSLTAAVMLTLADPPVSSSSSSSQNSGVSVECR
ncbi:hypothetical protein INR49_009770 [Caranx melampygus]|nr:hypothetical protein INR49_009770 [Caranx melampygus]